jgi:hypothetical protein
MRDNKKFFTDVAREANRMGMDNIASEAMQYAHNSNNPNQHDQRDAEKLMLSIFSKDPDAWNTFKEKIGPLASGIGLMESPFTGFIFKWLARRQVKKLEKKLVAQGFSGAVSATGAPHPKSRSEAKIPFTYAIPRQFSFDMDYKHKKGVSSYYLPGFFGKAEGGSLWFCRLPMRDALETLFRTDATEGFSRVDAHVSRNAIRGIKEQQKYASYLFTRYRISAAGCHHRDYVEKEDSDCFQIGAVCSADSQTITSGSFSLILNKFECITKSKLLAPKGALGSDAELTGDMAMIEISIVHPAQKVALSFLFVLDGYFCSPIGNLGHRSFEKMGGELRQYLENLKQEVIALGVEQYAHYCEEFCNETQAWIEKFIRSISIHLNDSKSVGVRDVFQKAIKNSLNGDPFPINIYS